MTPQERKEYYKEYYNKNKSELLEKLKKKVKCSICDCKYSKSSKSNHLKSKKHLMAVKLIKNVKKKILKIDF